MRLRNLYYLLILFAILFTVKPLSSQVVDTIANWDVINVEWVEVGLSSEQVVNPNQQGINPSSQCLEITTSNSAYDLIYTDFSSPVNFAEFPLYRLKILAPETGGTVLLKFENSDNTSWIEIEQTPTPGQWDELEFDFSGTTATDYYRMVIFFDFLGTTPDKQWYIDDILKESDNTAGLTTNLPIVIINTNGAEIPDEPKITASMSIINNGYEILNNQYDQPNDYDGYVGIEIRGSSSQMFPKKSYGFETRDENGDNLNVPLLGMPKENDWILYAPYSDKSMLRNFITFYIGSKLDTYGSRMAYCEVIINNDYKGVYILMEKIKRDDNRVDIAKLEPDEISGDDVTGGYIIKVDKTDGDFNLSSDGWISKPTPSYPNAKDIIFQYNYPNAEDIVQPQIDYIQNYISISENALTGTDFDNPNLGYKNYMDAVSFIDQMILCEIAKEVDNYRYSMYFYKDKQSNGGKLHAGPAWDFNLGYANVDYWPEGVDYTGWRYSLVEPNEWSIMFWWKRMMEDSYFKDLFFTRWQQLRNNEISNTNLEYAIDSIVNYIDEAQIRNYERWPILGEYVWPNYNWQGNNYTDEVDFFENWLFNRVSWIDDNIQGSSLNPSAELSSSYPDLEINLLDDYFRNPIMKNSDFLLNNAPSGMTIESVTYLNANQAKINLSENTSTSNKISVTIKSTLLNGFNDITTNELSLGNDLIEYKNPAVNLYTNRNKLHIECNNPGLLGDVIQVFNIWGQNIISLKVELIQINIIDVNIKQGIYICRYKFDGKLFSSKVTFVD